MNTRDKEFRERQIKQDFYAVLGVPRDAPDSEMQAAYRRLAREWHPDLNRDEGAVAEFMLINEAYSVLSNPSRRRAYDRSLHSRSTASEEPVRGPVRCAECGRPTAQPRVIVVRTSVGLGLWSHVHKAEGLYCSTCARTAAMRASLASAAVGWWALPFGPIVTAWCIWSNAFMSRQRHPADRRLALVNARAFLQRQNFGLAQALARQAGAGADRLIAAEVEDILRKVGANGEVTGAVALHDSWRLSVPHLAVHGLLCAGPPTAAIIALALLVR